MCVKSHVQVICISFFSFSSCISGGLKKPSSPSLLLEVYFNQIFSGPTVFQDHLNGKKHKKKAALGTLPQVNNSTDVVLNIAGNSLREKALVPDDTNQETTGLVDNINKVLMEKERKGIKLYGFKFEQQKTENYHANQIKKMHYTLDIGRNCNLKKKSAFIPLNSK